MKRHCDLCNHQKLSLDKGSICDVTNTKPSFNRTCIKVKFGNKFNDQLTKVLVEYEELKQSKSKAYKNYFFGLFFGTLIVLIGYFSWNFLKENVISLRGAKFLFLLPALALAAGYYIIKNTINKLNKYKAQLIYIENEKLGIDEVLNLYNKKYEYEVRFNKEIHGIKEVEIDLNFN